MEYSEKKRIEEELEQKGMRESDSFKEKNRKNMVENIDKEKERKARTHRMIIIGATLAKYMPELNDMTDDEIRINVSDLAKERR